MLSQDDFKGILKNRVNSLSAVNLSFKDITGNVELVFRKKVPPILWLH